MDTGKTPSFLHLDRTEPGYNDNIARSLQALLLSGLLAGCAVGPDFKKPSAPDIPSYTATHLPAQTASAATALGGMQ